MSCAWTEDRAPAVASGMERSLSDVLRLLEFRNVPEPSVDAILLQDSTSDVARYEVDYSDREQVFEVTIRRVARRWLDVEPGHVVARVGGVPLTLVSVAVALRVEVVLDAAQAADQAPVVASAPDMIGGRLRVAVRDDVGTTYTLSSGEEGGSEHPWRVRRCFLPRPPADATTLTLEFSSDEGDPVVVQAPLADG